MRGSRRAICALQRGTLAPRQARFIQASAHRQLQPLIAKGETPDPQLGSYPQLKGTSTQDNHPLKSGNGEAYWDTQYRRNFNEPLHEEDEALNMFSPDLPHTEVEPSSALVQAGVAFAVLGSIMGVLAYTRPTMPAERRSFPHDGLVNELGGWDAHKAKTESLEEH